MERSGAFGAAAGHAQLELGSSKGSGQLAIEGLDAKGRQAADVAAGLAEEVWVVVDDGAAGVQQFVAPDPIAQVHSAQDAGLSQVRENPPDRGLVVGALGQGAHHLFVGEGSRGFVQDHEHPDAGARGAKSSSSDELADLLSDMVEVLGQAGLREPA